jgi:hypothetical protein
MKKFTIIKIIKKLIKKYFRNKHKIKIMIFLILISKMKALKDPLWKINNKTLLSFTILPKLSFTSQHQKFLQIYLIIRFIKFIIILH